MEIKCGNERQLGKISMDEKIKFNKKIIRR